MKGTTRIALRAGVPLPVALLALAAPCSAQQARPLAMIDTADILIGQQTTIDLSITYRVDEGPVTIAWPPIADTLTGRVEVVHAGPIDTVQADPGGDANIWTQHRAITITSFDSGYWAIPPFRFTVNGDTTETTALLLGVRTVDVDTSAAFRDIKDIYELPFSWSFWFREHWPWIAGGAGVAAALVLLVFQLRRRPRGVGPARPEPEKPLDIRTLEALEAVGTRKLWQQGLVKQHHSEITDILRGYVEERFRVPALERTTDELIKELGLSSMTAGHREQLANLLRLADMVKFAKWNPTSTENEHLLIGALQLVRDSYNGTTPTPDAPRP